MLWLVAATLTALWVVAMAAKVTVYGLIHLLLLLAVLMVVAELARRKPPSEHNHAH